MASLDFVPSDYKIKYIDSLIPSNIAGLGSQFESNQARTIRIKIAKDIIEDIYWPDADLTVGWLLSEITRRYDQRFEDTVGKDEDNRFSKKLIVGLKTMELLPALDYYLTHLDNWLRPIRHNTLLAVHYAKINEENSPQKSFRRGSEVCKEDFQFLKVIGCGGYANVVLARK